MPPTAPTTVLPTDGRSRKDPEATRAGLITAALELFSLHGPTNTTLADVALSINLSKGAVTHHFDSKDSLVDAVLAQCATTLCSIAETSAPTTLQPLTRARTLLTAWWNPLSPSLRVFASLSSLALHDPRLSALIELHSTGIIATLTRHLDDCLSPTGAHFTVSTEEISRWSLTTALGLALSPNTTPDARHTAESALAALIRW